MSATKVTFKRPDRVNGGLKELSTTVAATVSVAQAVAFIKFKYPDAVEVVADGAEA